MSNPILKVNLKTKYKFLLFVLGRENEWTVWNNKSDDFLGVVSYYMKWKEWVICLEPGVIFSIDCLSDATDFIKQLNHFFKTGANK